jgi:hypothetical protein
MRLLVPGTLTIGSLGLLQRTLLIQTEKGVQIWLQFVDTIEVSLGKFTRRDSTSIKLGYDFAERVFGQLGHGVMGKLGTGKSIIGYQFTNH